MTIKSVITVMRQLTADGDFESYNEFWRSINTLWNLGLVPDNIHNAVIHEDHRAWDAGEQDAWKVEDTVDISPILED